MKRGAIQRLVLTACSLLPLVCLRAQPLTPVPPLGISLPPGFRVSLFADHRIANDIRSMTLNPAGDVVVSGPGYIRILHDADTNGVVEGVTLFAAPANGATAMAFDGTGLITIENGGLWRYRDNDANGVADGPPERLFEFTGGERPDRALARGPDGWWYILTGHGAGLKNLNAPLDSSPVHHPEGGVLMRFSPDWKDSEILADGFFAPGGLDFNWLGDSFTLEAETAADFLLPWYAPAGFLHVAYGGHHGWRPGLQGGGRARPGYYLDVVGPYADAGHALPSSVVCYQHRKFPVPFHDGLFAADWASGRIFFTPLHPVGSTYEGAPEVFLEPLGNSGFAPTALAVAPDGSLLIATGGRRLRGAVYRVAYGGVDALEREDLHAWLSFQPLERALRAPQPLAAWSFAEWEATATRLDPAVFARVVVDPLRPVTDRVRAIEILTRLFDGLPPREAQTAARAAVPEVRARTAWSLGFKPCQGFTPLLLGLAADPHPLVRRCALESLLERYLDLENLPLAPVVESSLAFPDKRVRLLAARLASRLPAAQWNPLKKNLSSAAAPARLAGGLAACWREPGLVWQPGILELALGAWNSNADPLTRTEALRLLMLDLGDQRALNPPLDTYSGYELNAALAGHDKELERVRTAVRRAFPSANAPLNVESARLLAMLGEDDPQLPRRVLAQITGTSPSTLDFHYLAVLSRLPSARPVEVTTRTADAITGLGRKLAALPPGTRQHWGARLAEVAGHLLKRDPLLAETLLRHPDFAREALLPIVPLLTVAQQQRAAALFLQASSRANFAWSPPMVDLIGRLPPDQTRPVFRRQWSRSDPEVRDALARQLAAYPSADDRDRYLAGLDSPQFPVAEACAAALLALPRDDTPRHLAPVIRLLARSLPDPKLTRLRGLAVAVVNRQTGQQFKIFEKDATPEDLHRLYQPVLDWFAATHPELAKRTDTPPGLEGFDQWLRTVPWTKGNPARGAVLFHQRCSDCHGAPDLLGADVADAARRLVPLVLFHEIGYPALHVGDDYRLTEVRLKSGPPIIGLLAHQSSELCLIQTAANPIRVPMSNVAGIQPIAGTLMPSGLLRGLKAADAADLYAYLKSLPGAQ